MSTNIVRYSSVNDLHKKLGLAKPEHPLITVLDVADLAHGEDYIGQKIVSELYCIALKDGSCGIDYGRNHYDFNSGALMFTAPGQVIAINRAQDLNEIQGWLLYFHPDLIRSTPLGQRMKDYSFFAYEVYEALHVSEQEQAVLDHCIEMIKTEISERIDNHSQQVLSSNIALLLNYSRRFYERQFNTRAAVHSDVISKVENLLSAYYSDDRLLVEGPPTIQYLADECHLSAGYLSDLLKKETGHAAKDHINTFLVNRAKTLLLGSDDTISGIAYTLGFNYPHYFSRLFKSKTGMTPQEYRQLA